MNFGKLEIVTTIIIIVEYSTISNEGNNSSNEGSGATMQTTKIKT